MILARPIGSYDWRAIARNACGDAAYIGRRARRFSRSCVRLASFAVVGAVLLLLVAAIMGLRHVLWRIDANLLYEIEHDDAPGA